VKRLLFGRVGTVIVILFAFHSARPAWGDAILISDNRSVATNGSWHITPFSGIPSSGSWNLTGAPSTPFADFNSTVIATPNGVGGPLRPSQLDVFAAQVSTITSTLFEASGTAHIKAAMAIENCSSGGCSMSGSAASVFEVTFSVAENHTFELSTLGLVGQIYLERVGFGKILTIPHSFNTVVNTGLLQPGTYKLHADHTDSFGVLNLESYTNCCFLFPPGTPDPNYYNLSFRMQSAAVPEPSSIILLSVCLSFAGISIVRRRG